MDYNNQLSELEINRQNDLTQLDQQYQNAITETEQAYKQAADQYTIDANDGRTTAVEQLMETQNALTEQAVKEIEQQREQSEKDYIKEQAGAYADWQKQSDAYGVNAEKMASNGLTRSGYSESSQVQMYSDYQSRVSTARDVFKRAELNFTNAIANARLQNNAALAQIALDAFQRQSEIALAGLTAKNGLLSEWTSQKLAVNTRYDNKYQTILDQIYREEQMQLQREQMAQEQARWQAQMAQNQAQFEASLQYDRDELAWKKEEAQLKREDAAKETAKTDKDAKFNLLANLISKHGHIASDDELAEAGMSRAVADSYLRSYNENKAVLGGNGNTGGNTGGNTIYRLTGDDGDTGGNGGNTGDTTIYLETYLDENTPRPKTYKEATAWLRDWGVDSSSLMSEIDWARHKNSGNATSKAVTQNATYQDYLYDYMRGALTAIWPKTPNYTDPPKKNKTANGAGGSANTTTWEKPTGAVM
jgi:hypothetical protein